MFGTKKDVNSPVMSWVENYLSFEEMILCMLCCAEGWIIPELYYNNGSSWQVTHGFQFSRAIQSPFILYMQDFRTDGLAGRFFVTQ